ncbi:nucleotidyltransferase family protein [Aurantiacibacter gangjinensis]|uniref:Uncharacterized protein n=1 Tax=Aurantiacibacter gangjinensis TaxID=502682 RepID=A0A0G9ML18_9SPHN|nr:nucleotidyltransferase family protein [Aurantiacibacter gangjinensis]APE27328.1 hypothetical protein BMF35_a0499 [Aurantiacibacter gangjinensis]KLE31426.1 hypothetical protein AAW01_07475 [Aurantiacibacter gangjinensis]
MGEAQIIDDWLAALLRGAGRSVGQTPVPARCSSQTISRRIAYHGIAHLLVDSADAFAKLPEDVAITVRRQAMQREYWEASHRHAITPLLAQFGDAGISPVMMKGTAFAYALYANPAARTRGDSDVLIPEAQVEAAREVLSSRGFKREAPPHGVLFQESWSIEDAGGLTHDVDLHWQVVDSPLLQRALPMEEVLERTIALPGLHEGARSLGYADSLIQLALNAEYHAILGYYIDGERMTGPRRLIWTYDTALLLRAMGPTDWAVLHRSARKSGIGPLLAKAVADASARLGVPVGEEQLAPLRSAPSDHRILRYLASADRLERVKRDFLASSGLRRKAHFLAAMASPSDDQLREAFPQAAGWPVALLKLRYVISKAIGLASGSKRRS